MSRAKGRSDRPLSFAPAGVWTLRAMPGRNIQVHFLDLDVEENYDIVEVRDGVGPNSTSLGEPRVISSLRPRASVVFLPKPTEHVSLIEHRAIVHECDCLSVHMRPGSDWQSRAEGCMAHFGICLVDSPLIAILTGSGGPAHDLFSTSNRVTVWFFTDSSGSGRGFKANFTSGVGLGSPGEVC